MSETLKISFKIWGTSVNDSELANLDKTINQRAAEGWELVTHSYMSEMGSMKNAILLTYRREKQ
jgi:hypothetical protein